MTTHFLTGDIRAGPIRPSGNVRVTCRFDYQPDICKDYKETGFCGFGDSCIFLHDRGDYKSGWQLDQDWDKEQKQKAKDAEMTTFLEEENVYDKVHDGEASEKDVKGTGRAYGKKNDEEDLPFACLLCRQEFTDPIVTRCVYSIARTSERSPCLVSNRSRSTHSDATTTFARRALFDTTEFRQSVLHVARPPMAFSVWPRSLPSGSKPRSCE